MMDGRRAGGGIGTVLAGAATASALVGAAPDAAADPGKTSLLFDAAAGAGVSLGSHFSLLTFNPAKGFEPGAQSQGREDIAGPTAALSLTPAYAWRWLAVGLGFDAAYVASLHRDGDTPNATLLSLSAVGIVRSEASGPAAALSFGWGGTWLPGVPATIDFLEVPPKSLFGPRIGARFGYEWASGFGVRTAVSYAYQSDGVDQYEPVTVVLQAAFMGK